MSDPDTLDRQTGTAAAVRSVFEELGLIVAGRGPRCWPPPVTALPDRRICQGSSRSNAIWRKIPAALRVTGSVDATTADHFARELSDAAQGETVALTVDLTAWDYTSYVAVKRNSSFFDIVERIAVLWGPVDLAALATVHARIYAIEFVVADNVESATLCRVVCFSGRLVVGEVVWKFCGQPLVQRVIVVGADPPIGRINDLVAVGVAYLVGIQTLGRVQHLFVVVLHPGRLPETTPD